MACSAPVLIGLKMAYGRKGRGRPRLLNESKQAELVTAIQRGATYSLACRYAGVSYASFNGWMNRGQAEFQRKAAAKAAAINLVNSGKRVPKKLIKNIRARENERLFFNFFNAIEKANAIAAFGWLQVIDSAAGQDPNWAAWQLKMRLPDEYGGEVKKKIDITSGGEPLSVGAPIEALIPLFQAIGQRENSIKDDTEPDPDPDNGN